jgi:hypothetical protein
MPLPYSTGERDRALAYAVDLVRRVCQLAGPPSFVSDLRAELRREGVLAAVEAHDTAKLFDWLFVMLSFQGIADRVAAGFIAEHGSVTWSAIERDLAQAPSCPKLAGYWRFYDCRFHKGSQTCAEPEHIETCPLPRHHLRNGTLNQAAFSLFLFIRDAADGDLVAWIDEQLAQSPTSSCAARRAALRRHALLEPLRHVYGVSDKVLAVALSALLIGAGGKRRRWFEVGTSFVAIDSLVHNFLHRSGILQRFAADHLYGSGCYAPGGCADILDEIARHIDAKAFNPTFPAVFPRFVQIAIWRYCAKSGFDICNGNRIDDRERCANLHCRLHSRCDRVALHAIVPKKHAISAA